MIAFSSRRSGTFQIWVADSEGGNERQLTFLESTLTGMPRWSPDGAHIAFDARVGGTEGVWVMALEGGAPKLLTEPPMTGFNPSWSRDGKSIYFASRMTGRAEIWKTPSTPQSPAGPPVQMTFTEGWNGFESFDGRYFYYARRYFNGPIMRIPAVGGEPLEIVPSVNLLQNLAVTKDALYFGVSESSQATQSVWRHSFASRINRKLLETGRRPGSGLTVAPDQSAVICALTDGRGGDLWLVEGLQQ